MIKKKNKNTGVTLSKKEREKVKLVKEDIRSSTTFYKKIFLNDIEDFIFNFYVEINKIIEDFKKDIDKSSYKILNNSELNDDVLLLVAEFTNLLNIASAIDDYINKRKIELLKKIKNEAESILLESKELIILELDIDKILSERVKSESYIYLDKEYLKLERQILAESIKILDYVCIEISDILVELKPEIHKIILNINKIISCMKKSNNKEFIKIKITNQRCNCTINMVECTGVSHLVEFCQKINEDYAKGIQNELDKNISILPSGYALDYTEYNLSGMKLKIKDGKCKLDTHELSDKNYSYKELNDLAEKAGYLFNRQKGDHGIFISKKDEFPLIIPQGRSIGKGLQLKILKQIGYII